MTKIKCQSKCGRHFNDFKEKVRIRIIKAPLVSSEDLRIVMSARARALVL